MRKARKQAGEEALAIEQEMAFLATELMVTIESARHLPKMDVMGTCDAFCELEWQSQKYKTTVKKNSYSPDWNETFAFPVKNISAGVSSLTVVVMDWDMMSKSDLVGEVVIPGNTLQAFLQGQHPLTMNDSFAVLNKGKAVIGNDKKPCVLNLKMRLLVPDEKTLAQPALEKPASTAKSKAEAEAEAKAERSMSSSRPNVAPPGDSDEEDLEYDKREGISVEDVPPLPQEHGGLEEDASDVDDATDAETSLHHPLAPAAANSILGALDALDDDASENEKGGGRHARITWDEASPAHSPSKRHALTPATWHVYQ